LASSYWCPSGGDVKIVEHKYGKVVWIQENIGNKYAAHFWVQRPTGWKLLHNTEIATRPASENPDGTLALCHSLRQSLPGNAVQTSNGQ
jgi:hypothetical protein